MSRLSSVLSLINSGRVRDAYKSLSKDSFLSTYSAFDEDDYSVISEVFIRDEAEKYILKFTRI